MKLTGLNVPPAKVATKLRGENKPLTGKPPTEVFVDDKQEGIYGMVNIEAPKPKPSLFAGIAAKRLALETQDTDKANALKESRSFTPNDSEESMPTSGEDVYVTAIHRETLEAKEIRMPNAEVQPNMFAAKKPVSGETTTSSPALKQNPFAKAKEKPEKVSSPLSGLAKAGKVDSVETLDCSTPLSLDVPKKNPLSFLGKSNSEVAKSKVAPPPTALKPLIGANSVNFFGGRKPKKPIEQKAPSLYGTGLTKNILGKAAKELEKEEAVPSAIPVVSESELLPQTDLPDTLMDAGIVLDEYQTPAVEGLGKNMYGVLIGAAGTGKTTALKAIVAKIEDSVVKLNQKDLSTYKETHKNIEGTMPAIAFCSFTGKAVQQMKRALPKKYHPLANTIHSTLGYAPVEEEIMDKETHEWKTRKVFRPTYTKYNKLPYRVIVIDEGGTVPVNLWHELLDALPDDCRVMLLGDLNQLPPVTGHSILGFAMLKWPTYVLEKLHRQAEGDPIAENAHRILDGKKPITDEKTLRFVVKKIEDGSIAARKQILGTIQHLHKQGIFDPMLDALIVPQNIGNIGQTELNTVLVNYFNPSHRDEEGNILNKRHIITAGYAHVMFAAGDKVMLTKNDTQRGLTNGMVGVVLSVEPNKQFAGERVAVLAEADLTQLDLADLDFARDISDDAEDEVPESERAASHTMFVKLQNVDEPVEFSSSGSFKTVMLAYAMTCHKSQGSEYRNVIVVAHASNLKMLTREWLYTAITRAKERVILLCNHRGLTHAVTNQRIKGDTIAEKAKKFLNLSNNQIEGKEVRLPEPSEIKSLTMRKL